MTDTGDAYANIDIRLRQFDHLNRTAELGAAE